MSELSGQAFTRHLLEDWFPRNRRSFWWRRDLDQLSPFQVVLTETLLWKTRAETVEQAGRAIVRELGSPERILERQSDLPELLRPFGLYNRRSRTLRKLASALREDHDGQIPESEEVLMDLPGVGQYIARATLTFAFRRPKLPIDVNTKRVLERHYDLTIQGVRKVPTHLENALLEILGEHDPVRFTWALIDYGATLES